MIHSVFLLTPVGDLLLEMHWRGIISRTVLDQFTDVLSKASSPDDVPPVISGHRHYFCSIFRDNLYFVAVLMNDVPPLLVIEFLHRTLDVLHEYFPSLTESVVKENSVIIYELLAEMLDNGFPITTEPNVLKEMIKPPSIMSSITNSITGGSNVTGQLPSGQLSTIPWRRNGVKYTNNEIFFDFIEEIDAIIDKNGAPISMEVQGSVQCISKLSGMPDLLMSFANPRVLDDVSFHPCVRFKRWESERVLSFVPPDGQFKLVGYHVSSQSVIQLPIYVKPVLRFVQGSGSVEISLSAKNTMGRLVEQATLELVMPKTTMSCSLSVTSGTFSFDPVSKLLRWDIGKVPKDKVPVMKGSVSFQASAPAPESTPSIKVDFRISNLAPSGVKVQRLDLYGEKYKPFKGVKYITKAGNFVVRT